MSATDRYDGLLAGQAIKAPVRVATTANITLSGTQTIDGVAVVADDRVLVKNQTTASQNGIWVVASSAWERAKDWDGNRDVRKGTAVYVTDGSTNSNTTWRVSTSNPIVPGTTSVSFEPGLQDDAASMSYTPAWSGATVSTVQTKLREVVRISDDDDWQAIYTYLGTVGGGQVIIPARSTVWTPPASGITIPTTGNIETIIEDGAIIDLDAMTDGTVLFNASGTNGTEYALSANSAKRSDTITISSANLTTMVADGLVVNDYVRVASAAIFDASRTSAEIGEIVQVKAIDTGTGVITLWTELDDDYNTINTATVRKVTLIPGVHFRGGGIFRGDNRTASTHPIGIRTSMCLKPFVGGDLRFEKFATTALQMRDVIYGLVDGIHGDNFGPANTAYLVSVGDASRDCLIKNFHGNHVRHLGTITNSSTVKGIPRRIVFDGFSTVNSARSVALAGGDAMDTHSAGEFIHFWNGIIKGASGQGVNFECPNGSLKSVFVYDSEDNGVNIRNESDREGDVVLENVHSYRARGTWGVIVQQGTNGTTAGYTRIKAHNVSAIDPTGVGIGIEATTVGKMNGVQASQLQVVGSTSTNSSIRFQKLTGFTAQGLGVKDPTQAAQHCVRVIDCLRGQIHGIVARAAASATGSVVYLNANSSGSCADISVDGITIEGPASGSYSTLRGVLGDNNAQNIALGPNNKLGNANTPISLGTGTGHSVAVNPTISADKGDAAVTLTPGVSETVTVFNTALTTARAVTLTTSNTWDGLEFHVVRTTAATSTEAITVNGKSLALGNSIRVMCRAGVYRTIDFSTGV